MGRTPLLESRPEIQDNIVEAIKLGLDQKQAAELAGISETQFYHWMKRGKDEISRVKHNPRAKIRKSEQIYTDFAEAIQRAYAEGEIRNAEIIWQVAQGGEEIVESSVTREINPKTGKMRITKAEIKTRTASKDWRAAAFILERRHPERWTKRTEISGPNQGPIKTQTVGEQMGFTEKQRLDKLLSFLASVEQRNSDEPG